MDELADDERGVSEATGVAILIGMTVVVTATVGLNVLVASEADTGPPSANFSYDYIESGSTLIITHTRGDEFPASDLVIAGPDTETTWAQTANVNASAPIGPGDKTQLSSANAYGADVKSTTVITIYYARSGNRTQLSQWSDE